MSKENELIKTHLQKAFDLLNKKADRDELSKSHKKRESRKNTQIEYPNFTTKPVAPDPKAEQIATQAS